MSSAKPSLLGGSMIIAGTAIGAGMLANPTATSGVWFLGSVAVLLYVWLAMCLSGLLLLEASTHFPLGASFHTMVSRLLGRRWNLISGFTIAFVLYSLTYAYIYVGGGLTQQSLALLHIEVPRPAAASVFLLLLAACVSYSTHWVGRASTVLIGAMLVVFLLATTGLISEAKSSVLFNQEGELWYWRYAWLALPVCLASFGFHGNVPGLRQYYQGQTRPVALSIIIGSVLALVVYFLWQLAIQGNLPRSQFAPVIAADGDVTALLGALSQHLNTAGLRQLLESFAFMAIISSFLGVTLGLFDYIRDLFGFSNQLKGRLATACITFVPPWLAYLFMPTGFVKVMGYVGLMAAVWAVLVPVMLVFKSRQRFANQGFRVSGGNLTLAFVGLFALLVLATQLLLLAGYLPVFTG